MVFVRGIAVSATTSSAARLVVREDVREFAQQRGLVPHLPALVEATEEVFAGANHLSVSVHDDPDVPDLRWLIFRAEVPWADPARARAARDKWYARTAAVCPGPLLTLVGLDIDRRPE